MTITIGTGEITIVKGDGAKVSLSGVNIVSINGFSAVSYNKTPRAFNPAQPWASVPLTTQTDYGIVMEQVDGRAERFFLSEVTNQVAWTNNLTGVNAAVDALKVIL